MWPWLCGSTALIGLALVWLALYLDTRPGGTR